ncbi:MAG: hypothetical protein WAT74_17280 [Flavobacteriales bacterium]
MELTGKLMDLEGEVGAELKGPALSGTYPSALLDYAEGKGIDIKRYTPVGLNIGVWQGGSCSFDIICTSAELPRDSDVVPVVYKRVNETWDEFCNLLGRLQMHLFTPAFKGRKMELVQEEEISS